ncbi:MAG: hypothetical protein HOK54_11160 [Alphaproteobacteria bacterium]|nr:hypothetical protein [Alphaproteobacteria bacterium]
MALSIETFSNITGGFSFFKAAGHPLTAQRIQDLIAGMEGPVAIYDPLGLAAPFAEIHDCGALNLAGVFVQDIERIGEIVFGQTTQPVTDLSQSGARTVFIPGFDTERVAEHISHLLPSGAELVTLDQVRLEDEMVTNKRRYLEPMNFATNFAFFRDDEGHHTRVVSANYWAGYGAKNVWMWCCLFDEDGQVLVEWREDLPAGVGSVVIDSREVRERFDLGAFTGQLFLHAINASGHDVVKYALDTYGDAPEVLSCTHDANAWPSDLYAGLPAPADGEQVTLWVQNSHPCVIPAGTIGLNRMGDDTIVRLDRELPAFGSYALNVAELLPDLAWPEQIEIQAGKHFVRPRYEIANAKTGRSRISHPNVERVDLKTNPKIAELSNLLGKSYILPAPVLPMAEFSSLALPTPMSTAQENLPLALAVYNPDGQEVARHRFGCLPRDHADCLSLDGLVNGSLGEGYGHMELIYDFADGGGADGWLHGLFRYQHRESGHEAETSFGAHIFNTVLTYRNEPQSYNGPAPGLSTRLFLRLGPAPDDTMCHLIYSASTPWHEKSETKLILHDGSGVEIAFRDLPIPCGGSVNWRYSEVFDADERRRAGDRPYVIIRDVTCRLFGYHGVVNGSGSFSFDHMFGF